MFNQMHICRFPLVAVSAILFGYPYSPGETVSAQERNSTRNVQVERTERQGQIAEAGRRWALIVAVNNYDDPRVPDLQFCDADATNLGKALEDHCGYDARDVVTLSTAGRNQASRASLANMRLELQLLARRARPEDSIIVFFSGHGFLNDQGAGFLLPADSEMNDIEATSMPTRELRQALQDCPARQKLLVLDCCHAGGKSVSTSPDGETLGKFFQGSSGLLTMASCRAGEKSYEWPEKRNGIFTYFLIEGLRGSADAQFDNIVDTAELFAFVRSKTIDTAREELNASQTPTVIVPQGGELPVFALARVVPQVYREDFSDAKLGLLPTGWSGSGLTVQSVGGQNALQLREVGRGSLTLPPQKTTQDFFVECFFETHGYVNKKREFEIVLSDRDGRPHLRVGVDDRYPNCIVTINSQRIRASSVRGRTRLYISREGNSLSVKLNDETLHSFAISSVGLPNVRVSMANNKDEYGRSDSKSFPTLYAISIGPLGARK